MKKVSIIGGGITGLVTACELLKRGYKVEVYEASSKLGGLLAKTKMGKEDIEYIYHHIFTSDDYVLDLLDELNLKDDLKWYSPKNGLYIDSKIYPFTSPLDLLKFKPIPFIGRVRTGLSVLEASRVKNYDQLERITAKSWLVKKSGSKSYSVLWKKLLESKFDDDADKVSAVWIWNKFKLRGNSREKVSSEKLGYLDSSFSKIIDVLANKIKQNGGRIVLNSEVIKVSEGELTVLKNGKKETVKTDIIISSTATPVFAKIIKGQDKEYDKLLSKIEYKANICMILNIKNSLSNYYWTTVCEDAPFVLVIEQNNLVGNKKYNGKVIYLSKYLSVKNKMWNYSDEEVFKEFTSYLSKMFPHFSSDDVNSYEIFRSAYSQPVINLNYSQMKPSIQTPFKGIYLAGMSQIYPEDRGVNYAIRLAYEVVDLMKVNGD